MRFGEVKEPRVGCEPKGLFAQSKEGFIHGYSPNVARFDTAAVNSLPIGSSNNVLRMIRVSGSAGFKTDVAREPPNCGMKASKKIVAGLNRDAESIACAPSSASSQISYLLCSARGRTRQRIDGIPSTMKRLGMRYCC